MKSTESTRNITITAIEQGMKDYSESSFRQQAIALDNRLMGIIDLAYSLDIITEVEYMNYHSQQLKIFSALDKKF